MKVITIKVNKVLEPKEAQDLANKISELYNCDVLLMDENIKDITKSFDVDEKFEVDDYFVIDGVVKAKIKKKEVKK